MAFLRRMMEDLFFVDTDGDQLLRVEELAITAVLDSELILQNCDETVQSVVDSRPRSRSRAKRERAAAKQSTVVERSEPSPQRPSCAVGLSSEDNFDAPVGKAEEYISLFVSKREAARLKPSTESRDGHAGRGISKKRRGKRAVLRDDDPDVDAEEMAVMMDYIQNASVGDLSSINLAPLPGLDDDDGLGGESPTAEVGMFEYLMMGLDMDDDDSDSSDSDSSSSTGALDAFTQLDLESDASELEDETAFMKAGYEKKRASDARSPRKYHSGQSEGLESPRSLSKTQKRKLAKREQRKVKDDKRGIKRKCEEDSVKLTNLLVRTNGRASQDLTIFLTDINKRIRTFVKTLAGADTLMLPAMPGAVRRLVGGIAQEYILRLKNRGKGKSKVSILIRTQRSSVPPNWRTLVHEVLEKEILADGRLKGPMRLPKPKTRRVPGAPDHSAKPMVGSVVGEGSKPIGQGNVGHRMLMAMGWSAGQALGTGSAEGGLVEPVEVLIRSRRSGLGTG
ncbi:hypothetical protein DFS34DRAFT_639325 [Phlyctochytrium arcticum]|nr:hypothetical protein DFS34DRAFT_639325 [Phlyctochytrium arcticum]